MCILARMGPVARWTLITNHGSALLFLSRNPGARVSELAEALGVTDRSAARILRDLRLAGYVVTRREGRRNLYQLDRERPLRHVLLTDWPLEALLEAFASPARERS